MSYCTYDYNMSASPRTPHFSRPSSTRPKLVHIDTTASVVSAPELSRSSTPMSATGGRGPSTPVRGIRHCTSCGKSPRPEIARALERFVDWDDDPLPLPSPRFFPQRSSSLGRPGTAQSLRSHPSVDYDATVEVAHAQTYLDFRQSVAARRHEIHISSLPPSSSAAPSPTLEHFGFLRHDPFAGELRPAIALANDKPISDAAPVIPERFHFPAPTSKKAASIKSAKSTRSMRKSISRIKSLPGELREKYIRHVFGDC